MKTKTKIISALGLIILVSLAVLGIFWFSQSAKLKATGQKAEAKLAEKFNQAPEIKNSYQLDKLSLIQPAKDENSVEVKLGEANAKEFVPNLEINKWDGETKFKLKPDVSQIPADQKKVTMDGDKINYETPKVTYQYYNKPDASADGGYEFSEILKVKPDTNVFTTPIETENLDFFYQPALNQEIKIGERGVATCTETQCFDKDGKVVNSRPENVVGSYAVYYKDGKSGDYSQMGGKNYMTGKAFHIYRPQVTDAEGNKVWGELNVDTDKGILAVTVPQDFLDKATYPVTVDPTFGYSSASHGLSSQYSTAILAVDQYTGVAGTGQSMSTYVRAWSSSYLGNYKMALYNIGVDQATNIITNGTTDVGQTSATASYHTQNFTVSPTLSAQEYGLAFLGENFTYVYYDSSGGNSYVGNRSYPAWATNQNLSGTQRVSIYVTYTASASAPTVTNSTGASNVNFTAARLNGEVTATGGENPTVHIYWGTTDGGTTAGSWANDVNLGALGAGTFYTDISSLTAGTTYYYRSYATNSGGSAWTASTATFNTAAIVCGDGTCNGSETRATCPADCPVINIQRNVNFGRSVNLKAGGVAAPAWACGDTIQDVDGNTYGTILIDTQCWMAENIMTTKYPDGTSITRGPTGATWNGSDNAYYAYPPNTANTAEETLANIQSNHLGFVYQWRAAMKNETVEGVNQGICPTGWHLPTDAQWFALEYYLWDKVTGTCTNSRTTWGCDPAGTKLKTDAPTGFLAPLAGYRNTNGGFYNRGALSYFWSSTQYDASYAWRRGLNLSNATVYRGNGGFMKAAGFSVRCLKN